MRIGLSHGRAAGRPKPLASAGPAGRYGSRNEGKWCQASLCSRASRYRSGERLWLCCRVGMLPQALSATLPTLGSPFSFAIADEAKSSSCGQSFWLPRSAQPSSARIRTHSREAIQPTLSSSFRTSHVGTSSFSFLGSATLAQNQALQARREKIFAAQNSGPAGFSLDSLPSAGT